MEFSKRMDRFGPSIFTELTVQRRAKEAQGESVTDMSIGTPNIPPAEHIKKAIAEAAMENGSYLYAIKDTAELREAAAQWYERRYGVTLDPETEICSLLGSQDGLGHIAMTVVDPGDVFLVPDPCYPVFADGPALAGAELYYMPMRKENDYLIDFDEIPEEIAKKAKMMLVSYPNNPTTALAPASFYEKLIAFAKKYDIKVLHDNAYSELIFDGEPGRSFLSYPGAKDVGVEFNSLSKTYSFAGARCGFCLGNKEIVGKLATLKSIIDYGMFLPVQKGAIAAITGDQSVVEKVRAAYKARRDAFCDGMTAIGWPIERGPSTMFVWAKLPEGWTDSAEFVKQLLDRSDLLVTPGSAFGPSGEGYVRVALVQDVDEIQKAIARVDACGILKEKA